MGTTGSRGLLVTTATLTNWVRQRDYLADADPPTLSPREIAGCTSISQIDTPYDSRGQVEIELKADKDGLGLAHRQKQLFAAQEALLLLTDLAHNLVTWLTTWIFHDTPVAQFGPKRFIRDVFAVPGRLIFKGDRLVHVAFWDKHPYGSLWAEYGPKLFRQL